MEWKYGLVLDTEYWAVSRHNNINSQLDVTITNLIDNYNQLNMFRAIISPIIRSTRLCLQLVIYSTDDDACW